MEGVFDAPLALSTNRASLSENPRNGEAPSARSHEESENCGENAKGQGGIHASKN